MPTNPLGSALLMNKNKKPHYSGFTDNIQYSHKWGLTNVAFSEPILILTIQGDLKHRSRTNVHLQ